MSVCQWVITSDHISCQYVSVVITSDHISCQIFSVVITSDHISCQFVSAVISSDHISCQFVSVVITSDDISCQYVSVVITSDPISCQFVSESLQGMIYHVSLSASHYKWSYIMSVCQWSHYKDHISCLFVSEVIRSGCRNCAVILYYFVFNHFSTAWPSRHQKTRNIQPLSA